jgi:hypothetical protein
MSRLIKINETQLKSLLNNILNEQEDIQMTNFKIETEKGLFGVGITNGDYVVVQIKDNNNTFLNGQIIDTSVASFLIEKKNGQAKLSLNMEDQNTEDSHTLYTSMFKTLEVNDVVKYEKGLIVLENGNIPRVAYPSLGRYPEPPRGKTEIPFDDSFVMNDSEYFKVSDTSYYYINWMPSDKDFDTI